MLRYVKNGMLLLSVAYIVIGMLLLIMPETSLLWICYAFGAVVLITGIVCLVQYARIRGTGFTAPFMLVGGATGLIGAELVDALNEVGCEVVSAVRDLSRAKGRSVRYDAAKPVLCRSRGWAKSQKL